MAVTTRVVLVTRKTDYARILEQHGTHQAARFFLQARGQDVEVVRARHERFGQARHAVLSAIPSPWRRARVQREDLHRFVFEPADVVVALGQDGLVANLAKYLTGQVVVGVNPEPEQYDGILVPHAVDAAAELLRLAAAAPDGQGACEHRTMVEARLDDGQRLLALNEVFVGHQSHQSARYRIACGEGQELHSSSGVVIATGTGATGWARSIRRARRCDVELPKPEDRTLAYFVREAFPSAVTGTSLTEGVLSGDARLELTSRMNDGGVVFGDGIESDRLAFGWGQRLVVGIARERLHLLRGNTARRPRAAAAATAAPPP